MTLAPNCNDLNESNLPHDVVPKRTKKSQITRAKVNNANSLSDSENDHYDDENDYENDNNENILDAKMKNLKMNNDMEKYKCLLDLKQKLIEAQENQTVKPKPKQQTNDLNLNQLNLNDLEDCLKILSNVNLGKNGSENNNERNRYSSNSEDVSISNGRKQQTLSTLDDEFKYALNELEHKLAEFERLGGKEEKRAEKSNKNQNKTNSSYTLSLIQIISRLLDNLKETKQELNHERLKQSESNKQLDIHRKLIDGLTTEILCVKEQNEKIINEFVNQQAKLEAELEQMKNLFRGSTNMSQFSNYLPINDQKSKLSSFATQSHSNLHSLNQNLIRPQPVLSQQRPMSCVSSINTNEEGKMDKFAERLNAMLNYDTPQNCLSKSSSITNFQPLMNNKNFMANQNSQFQNSFTSLNRLSSASFNNDYQNNYMDLNYSSSNSDNKTLNDFNSKIQELSNKNVMAQQKLKQLQFEQLQQNQSNQASQKTLFHSASLQDMGSSMSLGKHTNASIEDPKQKVQREALEKLKKEQQTLKEQISLLNKQRESAQNELEALASSSSNKSNDKANNENIQNTIMKHFQEINSSFNNEINDTTPSLSPIQPGPNK